MYLSAEESYYALLSKLEKGIASRMAELEGVLVDSPSRRFELLPYAVSNYHSAPATPGDPFFDGTATNGRIGLDLSYGLGASFTLDATINPDFGQVEADPAVINLSAFETFQGERRPFFVEDARIFDFTLSGKNNQLFYSRRVGRAPHGRAPYEAEHSQDEGLINPDHQHSPDQHDPTPAQKADPQPRPRHSWRQQRVSR